jgi:hypothetical protein
VIIGTRKEKERTMPLPPQRGGESRTKGVWGGEEGGLSFFVRRAVF